MKWVSVHQGISIRIGVLENNKAVHFLEKTGYKRAKKSKEKRDKKEERKILLMDYLMDQKTHL